jgi:peptidoglycan/xylan/chitin deacetylase (PgdA/CDA1 family)
MDKSAYQPVRSGRFLGNPIEAYAFDGSKGACNVNPIAVAIRGKGIPKLLSRGARILRRYGLTAAKLDRGMGQIADLLRRFECAATWPTTTVALKRNPEIIKEYQAQGIEFAVHGYRHEDYSQLSGAEQLTQLRQARQVFEQAGVQLQGFRSPYLRWNEDTRTALRQVGLIYDSSQGLAWDVLDGRGTAAYEHVLGFYGALPAADYPSLPGLEGDLVCIPYSLPDDEALVERLDLETQTEKEDIWLKVLRHTYELGELFTLGLHPERAALCLKPLEAVLTRARQLEPAVWIARLDEIARWWKSRTEAFVDVTDAADGGLRLTVEGPKGTAVLARSVEVDAVTVPWADGYRRVRAATFTVRAPVRPFIGLSPDASPRLAGFLRQQGYIVETSNCRGAPVDVVCSQSPNSYSHYFDQTEFAPEHERPLLVKIEKSDRPLVRLGRWPDGARSALAVTGDIDALTVWDYVSRFLRR